MPPELMNKLKVPLFYIATKDEPEMLEVQKALKENNDKNKFIRFDDVHHGVFSARGDWTVKNQLNRVNEGFDLFINFFNDNFNNNKEPKTKKIKL